MSTLNETFYGFVETTTDTLLIFEACRRGILPKINRRLQERERGAVRSGTVFVFDERESGIKRWTDGFVWSPSRILGNFLIYRELENRESNTDKRRLLQKNQFNNGYNNGENVDIDVSQDSAVERNRERALVGSLTTSYNFKKGGLIKKTMSIIVNGSAQHLISYYTKEDVLSNRLQRPTAIPELACLEIAPQLLMRQSFRIPPGMEHGEMPLTMSPISPQPGLPYPTAFTAGRRGIRRGASGPMVERSSLPTTNGNSLMMYGNDGFFAHHQRPATLYHSHFDHQGIYPGGMPAAAAAAATTTTARGGNEESRSTLPLQHPYVPDYGVVKESVPLHESNQQQGANMTTGMNSWINRQQQKQPEPLAPPPLCSTSTTTGISLTTVAATNINTATPMPSPPPPLMQHKYDQQSRSASVSTEPQALFPEQINPVVPMPVSSGGDNYSIIDRTPSPLEGILADTTTTTTTTLLAPAWQHPPFQKAAVVAQRREHPLSLSGMCTATTASSALAVAAAAVAAEQAGIPAHGLYPPETKYNIVSYAAADRADRNSVDAQMSCCSSSTSAITPPHTMQSFAAASVSSSANIFPVTTAALAAQNTSGDHQFVHDINAYGAAATAMHPEQQQHLPPANNLKYFH